MENNLWQHISSVRQKNPLVHNVTNFVVMNNTANALLAVGASPIMAHSPQELEEMVALSNAIVINIGTLDENWVQSMLMSAKIAFSIGKPWILDPVGAGATSYRDEVLKKLLECKPTVIRGNASEIIALAKANLEKTKGVDSTALSSDAIEAAKQLVDEVGCVVCISGAIDYIVDAEFTIAIDNGNPLMTKVTGLGCSATAIIGAFIGIVTDKTEATVAAMAMLSIAGEVASKESKGPGSLQVNLLDNLYNLSEETFLSSLKLKQYSCRN